jgi:lipopolysaccharide/colanic/teichoic acid biosynthesis glycosyltransferase
VNYVLFLGSLVLALVLAGMLRSFVFPESSARAWRSASLGSAGLMSSVWCWLYINQWASSSGAFLAVAGGLTGGIIATTVDSGLVENNAAPSVGVQEKVLAYHVVGDLHYPRQPRLKRALDVVSALVGLVATLPLWFVITVLVWFEEPGPIFFIKNSVGKGGVTFRQVKFRSMKYGAERLTGPVASPANDPRTLKVGRLLRRWHFDELPELINVLAGTMSLVGPRPLRTVLVQRHLEEVPGYAERHTVKPGIACIAQIEKYYIAPAERLEKDREYIRRMSLAVDVKLLGRAVATTLCGERHRGQPADVGCGRASGGSGAPTSSASETSTSSVTGSPGYWRRPVLPGPKTRPVRPEMRSRTRRRSASSKSTGSADALPTSRRD